MLLERKNLDLLCFDFTLEADTYLFDKVRM